MCTSIVTGKGHGHGLHPDLFQCKDLLSSSRRAQDTFQVVPDFRFLGAGLFNEGQQHGASGITSNMRVAGSSHANSTLLLVSKFLYDLRYPQVADTATPKTISQAGSELSEFLLHQPRFRCNP